MNPWLLLGIAIMWGLSIMAASTKWASLKVAEVRAEYLVADNKALLEQRARTQAANKAAREAEQRGAVNVAAIGTELEKEKRSHAKTRADRDRALRAGVERVSVAVVGCQDGGAGAGAAAAGGAGEPAASRAYLHPTVAADLEQLAGEADDTARDLNACLKVAAEDRRIVNDWIIQRRESP